MKWRRKPDIARLSVVRAGKQAASIFHRVAVQGLEHAKLHGAKLARRIIAMQQAAGVTEKMIRESARSVAKRVMTRESDHAWQAGYIAEAARQIGGLVPEAQPDSRHTLTYATGTWDFGPQPPAAPARPERPHINPHGKPDLEAGQ